MKKNLVLTGMMGVGKSSIGKDLSIKLKMEFKDIDSIIEKKLSLSISEIFKKKGEKFFRDFEEKVTLDILKKKNIVISLGGGAFLNKNIRNEVINNHLSFWLKNKEETILKRIKNSTKRPIALKSNRNELIDLMKKRSKIYSKAMYSIECDNLTKTEIVKKILNIYETN